jgi:riboflavin kinase/FMN adenylyltransferase
MDVIYYSETFDGFLENTGATIGVFDGVHVGHQELIGALIKESKALLVTPTVITFNRHPDYYLNPRKAPKMLSSLNQRLRWFNQLGVKKVLVIEFNKEFASIKAEDFIKEILLKKLKTKLIVVGKNFKFGYKRLGDTALLERLSKPFGYQLEIFGPFEHKGNVVSSTLVRSLVNQGDIQSAQEFLGRPYQIEGVVVKGDGRGLQLGYPTANIATSPEILWPPNGIYAGAIEVPGVGNFKTAVSIGNRPTFYDEGPRALEAYLLDFSGNLYDKEVFLSFFKKLRNEIKFKTVEDLLVQMVTDVQEVRNLDYKIDLWQKKKS